MTLLREILARRRLLAEGAWVFAGQGGTALGTLVGLRVLTEVVTPEIFGSVALLLGLVALGVQFFCAPLNQASFRFSADALNQGTLPVLRCTMVGLITRSTAVLVVITLLAGTAWSVFWAASAWMPLLLAGLAVMESVRSFEVSLLSAARRQRPVALWGVAEVWVRPALATLAVWLLSSTIESVLTGYLAASILCWGSFRMSSTFQGIEPRGRRSVPDQVLRRAIITFALPLLPSPLFSWLTSQADRWAIGTSLGLDQVGIYAATCGLASRPILTAAGIVGQTLRPVYFRAVADQDLAAERRVFRQWLVLTGIICLGALAGFIVLGRWVGSLLLANGYHSGLGLLPWMALGYAFHGVANVFSERYYAHRKTKVIVVIHGMAAVLYIVLLWPLVRHFGLPGAVGNYITYAVVCTGAFALASRNLEPPLAGSTAGFDGLPFPLLKSAESATSGKAGGLKQGESRNAD